MRTYLRSFTYFRAVAILLIVAGHAFFLAGSPLNNSFEYLLANLNQNATVLFIFISGFLFHHIYCDQFHYGQFLKKKFSYVYVPYLIFSSLMIFVLLYALKEPPFSDYFYRGPQVSLFNHHIRPILLYLWTGRILGTYWYVPFIMIVYIASPLCVWFFRWPSKLQWGTALFLFAISNVVHRPVLNLAVSQAVIYFTPVYLFGILTSINREKVYSLFKNREVFLLVIVLALAIAQFKLQGHYDDTGQWFGRYGAYAKPMLERGVFDFQMPQKITMCLLLMVFLHRFENTNWKALNVMADLSFGIYFIHSLVLFTIARAGLIEKLPLHGAVLWIFLSTAIALVSAGMAVLIRRSFGKYSRLIFGC